MHPLSQNLSVNVCRCSRCRCCCFCTLAARVLTCTYVGLLCGLLAYNANFFSFEGLVSRTNFIFGSMMLMMLLPYVSISLYTSDKQIYLADASAKCYRPSAYYLAKVGWGW